ncbi:MAG: hypothetical protein U9O96_04235 [Candidatus Thermoplasmatota archaeon]|nr:hypothetical protein [Candidatus Thermoplasmatota archaeon]
MIGVLTSNFVLYHDLIHALQKRGVCFTSLTFDGPIPPNIDVVITSDEERSRIHFDNIMSPEPGRSMDELIDRILFAAHRKSPSPKIVIGIDPGSTPGIAIFSDGALFRRFTAGSPQDALSFIKSFVKNWEGYDIVLRIGHGARLVRNRMINMLLGIAPRIEIVNETSTTPPNTHDDMLAASAIALTPGRAVNCKLSLEPRDGEIRDTQRKSRILSKDVTISKELAKKVLKGEIEIKKAIEKQRGK